VDARAIQQAGGVDVSALDAPLVKPIPDNAIRVCDLVDALGSCDGERAVKRILRDPHRPWVVGRVVAKGTFHASKSGGAANGNFFLFRLCDMHSDGAEIDFVVSGIRDILALYRQLHPGDAYALSGVKRMAMFSGTPNERRVFVLNELPRVVSLSNHHANDVSEEAFDSTAPERLVSRSARTPFLN
jgi:hypothetical protein